MSEGNDSANDDGLHLSDQVAVELDPATQEAEGRFVGQWNRLVSTTNWDKGRIICQWRESLVSVDAPVTAYSDETWAQLVGGVTSQHVGRLRRVFQRFGAGFDQYEGLFWSHFQAAIEWDDAEMWLEGAITNQWSVSQMRGKRWETVGSSGDPPPLDDEVETEESDEEAAIVAPPTEEEPTDAFAAPAEAGSQQESASPRDDASSDDADDADGDESPSDQTDPATAEAISAPTRSRLAVEVDELPEDLADAFEQFKLAIISQRRTEWKDTTPEAVIECLDALRELTLAPAD